MAGCGGKKPYAIDGIAEGLGTQNVTAIYYDGTALKESTTNAVDSKFHIEGLSEEPVVIELYDKLRNRIGCVVARNGEKITVKFKVSDRNYMEATGNDLSAMLADFLVKNGGNLNEAIERQMVSAPGEALTALLAGYYYNVNADACRADSLLRMISDKSGLGDVMIRSKVEQAARIAAAPARVDTMRLFSNADSLVDFAPSAKTRTLYIFADIYTIPDSIVEYADSMAKEMRVASVRLSIDTFGWHKDVARFSKEVRHLWAPGGVANSQLRGLNIPQIPYYIVTDTAANQIYRGNTLPAIE